MTILAWVVFSLLIILLVLITSMSPNRPKFSNFEVARLAKKGDKKASRDIARLRFYDDFLAVLRISSLLLIIIIAMISVTQLGWMSGLTAAFVVLLGHGLIANLGFVRTIGQKLYDRIEPKLTQFISKFPKAFLLSSSKPINNDPPLIASQEELERAIAVTTAISTDEKRQLNHSLLFNSRLVLDIMTPRSNIEAVDSRELLGPLTLDELHKTGYRQFPVVEDNLDQVVGILQLEDLLTISRQKSSTAAKAMTPTVFYIHQNQTLPQALAVFIKTHHSMLIVVNEMRKTVGIISLKDVVKALLGRDISGELDVYDSLSGAAAYSKDR